MKNLCNTLLIIFASLLGYIVASRMIEETRDFR
ncbi:hypothetical protein DFR56_106132 [Pseudogracilibacillus auburnensis]|uniref:Uncharacterized protein n=1 Tax=Pseudogracilibacillus auburnensis TaxID=1494959 RepID=A0A2V3VYE5_9BACI|nr:hypothetical protein DFR56_106132 [Pseudogracilibacillus auburnensis]